MNLLPLHPNTSIQVRAACTICIWLVKGCCLRLIMCTRVRRAHGMLDASRDAVDMKHQTAVCCLIPLEWLSAREIDSWEPRDEHARPTDHTVTNDRYACWRITPSFKLSPATRFLLETKSRTSRHQIISTLVRPSTSTSFREATKAMHARPRDRSRILLAFSEASCRFLQ
jgi:hypothetical protein